VVRNVMETFFLTISPVESKEIFRHPIVFVRPAM
jgi:hypothetical protein